MIEAILLAIVYMIAIVLMVIGGAIVACQGTGNRNGPPPEGRRPTPPPAPPRPSYVAHIGKE